MGKSGKKQRIEKRKNIKLMPYFISYNRGVSCSLKVINADIICYMLRLLVYLQQLNVKNPPKLMKLVNIDEKNLYIFRMT